MGVRSVPSSRRDEVERIQKGVPVMTPRAGVMRPVA